MRRSGNIEPAAGEVWLADLGMTAKNRPVLVLAYPRDNDARALVVVAPLTSQIRGYRGEVDFGRPRWLPKPSVVNVQGLASFDRHGLSRRLGHLSEAQMTAVKDALRDLLGLWKTSVVVRAVGRRPWSFVGRPSSGVG